MEKTQIIWDALLAYIHTYDVIFYSTNGICSLIFLACVAVLSKDLGVFGGRIQIELRWLDLISTVFLLLSIVFCIVVFISNFYLQVAISGFFEPIFMQKATATENCCKWDGVDKFKMDEVVQHFRATHNEKIKCLVEYSISFCAFSSGSIAIWFAIRTIRAFRTPPPKGAKCDEDIDDRAGQNKNGKTTG